MARLGPGVACVGSSGERPSDGVWEGRFWKGDGPTTRCSTRCSGMAWWQQVGVWVSGYNAEVYAPPVGRGGQGLLRGARA